MSDEVVQDLSPLLRIYKDGRVERLMGTAIVPPSLDPNSAVLSKDVVYSPELELSSRLYLPTGTKPNQKLPLLVYFHGGGFCIETAFSPTYHNFFNTFVADANIIVVSVGYRRAPEHPLPAAYDDCWTAFKWVASHVARNGPEEWLNSHADFNKVFFAGDSAGGNIAYNMGMRYGQENVDGVNLVGMILIHTYFWGSEPVGDEPKEIEKRSLITRLWHFTHPTTTGCDDPLINPFADPKFGSLGCARVLILVAEQDLLVHRGRHLYEQLGKSGWGGKVEIVESKEENHVFHLFKPTCENAVSLREKMADFLNQLE